ncbi:hypothetical protein CDAR_40001 [Caerostris darwini]|uniref:Uncharacterized protein n=1 Tax=Caerostris darwini TaxID=1538125 RepID=A0AAV4RAW9_9ARAC|nr:hypothetical protein CDAR_40001 [Caerostris darwini]
MSYRWFQEMTTRCRCSIKRNIPYRLLPRHEYVLPMLALNESVVIFARLMRGKRRALTECRNKDGTKMQLKTHNCEFCKRAAAAPAARNDNDQPPFHC